MLKTSVSERLQPEERSLLRNTRRNIQRLNMMIDDLLALNQIEAGALYLDREPVDLRSVVTDAILTVHLLMREKG
jgi:signal transduction histidine kinase